IYFVGDVGEEGLGDLRGIKFLFENSGIQVDYFISIEPGHIRQIINGALGSNRYLLSISGPGGHSWRDFGTANPIQALSQVISIFIEKADLLTQKGIKTSYNVGKINGGTSVNA